MTDPSMDNLLEPLGSPTSAPAPSNEDLVAPLQEAPPTVAPTGPVDRRKAFDDISAAADVWAKRIADQEDEDAQLEQQLTAYRAAHANQPAAEQVDVLRYSAAMGLPPELVEKNLDTLKQTVDQKALAAAIASRGWSGRSPASGRWCRTAWRGRRR
jgi:hypothetical protein